MSQLANITGTVSDVITEIQTDAGTATPVLGVINILGGTNITTSAVGNTIVIDSTGSISPLTTKGDLYTFTTMDARLGVGIDGQVLTANSGQPTGLSWTTPTTGTVTSVTGTPNRITSTGGVNPQIDIAATYVGQTSITTLGTVSTGIWNGTPIDLASYVSGNLAVSHLNSGTSADATTFWRGDGSWAVPAGTGITGTTTNHAVIVGAGVNTVGSVGPSATAGQVLQSGGAVADPAYSTATYPSTATGTGTILRADGTNWTATTSTYPNTNAVSTLLYASSANVMSALSTSNNGLLVTSNTGVPSILAGPGATGKVLQSNTASAPSFSTATYPSTATSTGTILRADGTNWVASTATYPNTAGTAGKVLISDGTNFVSSTPTYPNASATAGKVLISDGTNFVASTPTYPNASASSGKILISDGTNFISSTPTYPNASASTGKFIISDGTNFIASTPTIPNTAGTSGKVLVSDGTNFISSTPTFPNASATSRKIIVSDGTNWVASTETYAVPGTSGNVMKSDGTNWTSATASSIGSWVIIQSQAASSSATVDFTTGINAGSPYVRWVMVYRAIDSDTDGSSLRMQISTNGGSSWVATNYTSGENSAAYNTATLTNLNSSTNFYVSALLDTGAATSMGNGIIWINNIASQGTYIYGNGAASDSGGTANMVLFGGKCTTSGANAFRMILSSGSIASGTFTLYGLLES